MQKINYNFATSILTKILMFPSIRAIQGRGGCERDEVHVSSKVQNKPELGVLGLYRVFIGENKISVFHTWSRNIFECF